MLNLCLHIGTGAQGHGMCYNQTRCTTKKLMHQIHQSVSALHCTMLLSEDVLQSLDTWCSQIIEGFLNLHRLPLLKASDWTCCATVYMYSSQCHSVPHMGTTAKQETANCLNTFCSYLCLYMTFTLLLLIVSVITNTQIKDIIQTI
jgi:hypothetical protein